jgi:universal stress protein A
MSRILVAVDLSEASKLTVEFAANIAAGKEASVDLVHVLVSSIPARAKAHAPANILEKMNSTEEREAQRKIQTLMVDCVPLESRGDCVLRSGEPAKTVCEQASVGYEMVVVSTHGRTGIGHVVLGSVAERIVRFATIPVLVVR